MRFTTIAFTVALFAAGVLKGQDSASAKKAPSAHTSHTRTHKKPAATAQKTATSAKTSTPGSIKTASHKKASKSSKKSVATVRRSNQQQPTPDRYKDIQQALAERGYFNGSIDGNWGADSVEALKRFQREQNLTDDGKLGSLSLIALGLGPRRAEPLERSAQQ